MGESRKHRKKFSILFIFGLCMFSIIILSFQNCAKSNKYSEVSGETSSTTTTTTEETATSTTTSSTTTTTTTTTNTMEDSLNDSLISTGNGSTCAIKNKKLYCWGYNNKGQVSGDGTTGDITSPKKIGAFDEVTAVSSNTNSTCFINKGKVYCWGDNSKGQLGSGNTTDQKEPTKIDGLSNVSKITSGANHTCALIDDDSNDSGSVKCWGDNRHGQIGINPKEKKNKYIKDPREIKIGSNITSISAGNNHTCAIKENGSLWCWGGKPDKKNETNNYYKPKENKAMKSGAIAVAAGFNFTCALRKKNNKNTLVCWGDKNYFTHLKELDDSETTTTTTTATDSNTSSKTSSANETAKNAKNIFINSTSVCIAYESKNLKCFGYWGKDGNSGSYHKPKVINFNDSDVTSVSRGNPGEKKSHICAFLSDGNLYCWGANNYKQSGSSSDNSEDIKNPTKITLSSDE